MTTLTPEDFLLPIPLAGLSALSSPDCEVILDSGESSDELEEDGDIGWVWRVRRDGPGSE
jgi:hypothetical protein